MMRALFILVFMALPFFALAQTDDAQLEARAKEVGHALRCVVCQNQSIEESDASLAEDMRRLVRVRLKAGDSNQDVIDFMQERYGDYVLLKPPVQSNTYVLWFAPFALVLLGGLWFWVSSRRTAYAGDDTVTVTPLSEDERAALKTLMQTDRDIS